VDGWQVAGGTVTGTMHLNPVKFGNNQDAFFWQEKDGNIIAVVSDGCGSMPHSEVGAKIGCRCVTERVLYWLDKLRLDPILAPKALRDPFWWEAIQATAVDDIYRIACNIGPDLYRNVKDFFLFTVNGILVTEYVTVLFSIGDGFAMLNGHEFDLGQYPEDAPPYMMYSAIQHRLKDPTPELYKFQVHAVWLTKDVNNVVIGSDGVGKYLMPVLDNDISEFWQDDRYFQNPDMVRRRLATINKTNFVKVRGPLRDDTTLVVIRRSPGAGDG